MERVKHSSRNLTALLKLTCCLLFGIVASIHVYSVQAEGLPAPAWLTSEEKAWIEAHPEIIYGTDINYQPYEFINAAGEMEGITADYLQLISEATGLKFRVDPELSWSEVLDLLKDNRIDMTPVITITDDRRPRMLFTEAYLQNPYVIVTRKDGPRLVDEYDLEGKRVALVEQYAQTEFLLDEVEKVFPVFFETELESLKAVSSGRVTATLGRIGSLSYQIQSYNLSNLKVAATTTFPGAGLAMAVRSDWPILRDILDKALANIPEKQRQEIAQRWITVDQDIVVDMTLVWEIIAIGIALLIPLSLWNRRLRGAVVLTGKQLKRELTLRMETETRFASLFENATEALMVVNVRTGHFYEVNSSAVEMFGLSKEQLIKSAIWEVCPDQQPEGVDSREALREKLILAQRGQCPMFEWHYKNSDGQVRPCEMRIVALSHGQYVRCSMIDIYERKQSEKDIELLAQVFSSAIEGAIITDKELHILRVNEAFTDITGYTTDEMIGKSLHQLLADKTSKTFFNNCWRQLDSEGVWQGELQLQTKGGHKFPSQQNISVVKDERGEIVHLISLFADISEQKRAAERLYRLAHFDHLTNLPNRTYLVEYLEEVAPLCWESDEQLALLTLDLDHFKSINDSLGHPVGDAILLEVSKRFRSALRESDTLVRIGGDAFAVLLEDVDDPGYAAHVAANLISTLVPVFWVEGLKLNISVSIGICLSGQLEGECPGSELLPATLTKNSESAMYQAKEIGRSRYVFYTPELSAKALERVTLGVDLRQAIESQKGLEVWYQPQFSLVTGDIFGVEALVRWRHPEQGLIPPDRFISLAEELGLIFALGSQVLKSACQDMAGWLEDGITLDTVAVNVSGHQVQSADFENIVYDVLEETSLAPEHLQLEITESILMSSTENAIALMGRLKAHGITMAIDDFGTGYSSLSYLKQLPLNKLKIDQTFVRGLPDDINDGAIVKAIIALSETLNLDVIAEGIETESQLAYLQEAGCLQGQGYLKGRPMPAQELETLLAQRALQESNL